MKRILFLLILANFIFSGCARKTSSKEQLIIEPIESMPSFPGGEDSLFAYLKSNNKLSNYPLAVKGRVIVGFVVNEQGEIKDIKLHKKLHPTCDNEAIRLIRNMPKWLPAEENGKPIPKRMYLPISFNKN